MQQGLSAVILLALIAPVVRPASAKDAPPAAAPKVAAVTNEEYPKPFRDAVNKAVAKGVASLKTRQTDDGGFDGYEGDEYPFGEAALATFTLLQSGVELNDPALVKALGHLRTAEPKTTYELGLCCLAIGAIADATGDPFAEDAVDAKGRPTVRAAARDRLTAGDLKALIRWTELLRAKQIVGEGDTTSVLARLKGGGGWGYGKNLTITPPKKPGKGPAAAPIVIPDSADASNTQYALLGLKAAARCGVVIPPAVWRNALAYVLMCQQEKGPKLDLRANEVVGSRRLEWTAQARSRGFGYSQFGDSPTGSMTCAGVAGVLISRSELEGTKEWDETTSAAATDAVRDGLAWLQSHFTVARNPGESSTSSSVWFTYYLYGLERAGSLARTRFIGSNDWYLAGAKKLVAEQRPDGSFNSETIDTCFALLFLRRATVRTSAHVITPSDPPAADGSGSPSAGPVPTPPK